MVSRPVADVTVLRMNRSRCISLALLVVSALAIAACDSGDGDDGSKKGYSIRGLLAEIPVAAFDDESGQLQIVTGDLDLATEEAGLERPAADSDPGSDELLDEWLLPLTGVPRDGFEDKMGTLLPTAASPDRLDDNGEIAEEFGWSLLDVHSFLELQNPPETFTVLAADVTAEDLTDAIGDADDDIWRLGGDDFQTNLDEISAARPLGQSVRMALRDGLLAVSRSTPPVEDWLADDGDTLADDEALAAVAGALDDAGVYTAMLVEADLSFETSYGSLPAEQLAQLRAEGDLIQPFDALGVGLAVDDDDKAVATFVYHHADADTAEANAEIVENVFSAGTSFVSRRPLKEMFEVQDVKVDGDVVVATLGFRDARPAIVFQMILTRDAPTTHG